MNTVSIDHPELTAKELPAGLDPDAVAARKRRLMAGGTPAAAAEMAAIQAEQIQLDRDAVNADADKNLSAQNRGPRAHYPAQPASAPEATDNVENL